MAEIKVYGAGLAGCEAAWQAAERGVKVKLYEMKPNKRTPAHHSDNFAELVCSNSLRSDRIYNAIGLLKEELSQLGSLIMGAAYASRVPAGAALAVDRNAFSEYVTEKIRSHKNIDIISQEVYNIEEDGITVVATGPLTSEKFSEYIEKTLGCGKLHFFDAAAPIVDFSTVNMEKAFFASRYAKGDADYINCPMTKEEYDLFYNELISAKEAELKDFDREEQKDLTVFEGCMPVEVMAKRGYDTLRFGPMKPVGIVNPETNEEYYAVVQLRQDNAAKTMYNIVGFQTHLTFEEQKRVFRLIPGLENAEFLRYGVMHRNTYINSPELLEPTYAMRKNPNIYFAGQMTGVEGYIESAGSGFVAGINAARASLGLEKYVFPKKTMIGAMGAYVANGNSANFQPMNANFGIIEPLESRVKGGKNARNDAIAVRSLGLMEEIKNAIK